MKTAQTKNKSRKVWLPRKSASYAELSDFFDRNDGFDLLDRGITEIDPDREDLDRMLLEYWRQPNTKQLNIRIPASAKRMIERLAKRNSFPHIIQEFRRRIDARHQQMIARPCAGDIQQMPFRVVDLFEIRIVGDRFNPLLQWNHLVVTSHDHH